MSLIEVEVGDRFLSKDPRDEGRVVQVRRHMGGDSFWVVVEVHPRNPEAVGRGSRVSRRTLSTRYERVSR